VKIVVFLGPTMPVEEAEAILPAVYLPPVSRGDVYAAARGDPWAIAIVDGYFHRTPSVLHKEILWAMSRGIRVYGASSLGALRAAELARFGMIGVGRVFEAFRDAALEDDDEVAVAHGPADAGYLSGSEAMVNIRATLRAARSAGVIDAAFEEWLVGAAKTTFYPQRTWERLLEDCREAGFGGGRCARLETWLLDGRVDRKRLDAIEMLHCIAADRDSRQTPIEVAYRFNSTFMWEELQHSIDRRPPEASPRGAQLLEGALLDELRLRGDGYLRERERALTRVFATELALARGERAEGPAIERATGALRETRGLSEQNLLEAWLEREGLTAASFARLMEDEALIGKLEVHYDAWIPVFIRDSLRVSGRFDELATRAWEKDDILSRAGLGTPSLADAALSEPELWKWFFEAVLHTAVPDDLEAYAARHDFKGIDGLRRAVLREFIYLRKLGRRERRAVPLEARSG